MDNPVFAHVLDIDTSPIGAFTLSAEEVEGVGHNVDDCASSTTTFSSAGPSCLACIFCYNCVVSCGS